MRTCAQHSPNVATFVPRDAHVLTERSQAASSARHQLVTNEDVEFAELKDLVVQGVTAHAQRSAGGRWSREESAQRPGSCSFFWRAAAKALKSASCSPEAEAYQRGGKEKRDGKGRTRAEGLGKPWMPFSKAANAAKASSSKLLNCPSRPRMTIWKAEAPEERAEAKALKEVVNVWMPCWIYVRGECKQVSTNARYAER